MARDIGLAGAVQHRRSSVQRGFGGVVILALIAGLAATAGLFTFYRTDEAKTGSERATANALAIAKAALIEYAVGRGDTTGVARPGELPCPDTDAPGTSGYGWANTPCRTTASLMGRIPWKTLGIPEPKDGTGETLWYAISSTFRDWDSFPVGTADSARRINSDTRGTLTVRTFVKLAACDDPSCFRVDGVVTDAVAVIFSPGAAIGTQHRDNGAAGGGHARSRVLASQARFVPRIISTRSPERVTGARPRDLSSWGRLPAPSTISSSISTRTSSFRSSKCAWAMN